MKIAFVVHDYHEAAGHSRYVSELVKRYSTAHEVHVFANTDYSRRPSGVRFHHVPAFRHTALVSVLTFMLPATRLVKEPFDIVHAQGLCSLRFNVVTAHICNRAWYEARRETRIASGWRERLSDV